MDRWCQWTGGLYIQVMSKEVVSVDRWSVWTGYAYGGGLYGAVSV